jgi:adhesin/invasin
MRHLKDRSIRLLLAGITGGMLLGCGDNLVVPEDGNPAAITIVQGGTQTGTAGQALPLDLIVEVRDEVGRPIAQQPLTITLDAGGSITPSQPLTNGQGRAQFQWTLGPSAGTQELSVEAGGSAPSVTFHGTAASATANIATVVAGNGQSGQAGRVLTNSLVIAVDDQFGNPVSGAVVTWTTTEGSLSPVSTTTDAAGLARSSWTLGQAAGAQQAQASVAGIPAPVTFTAIATPGPAPVLSIQRQPPPDAKSGEPLTRQPRIQLQDSEGNNLSTGGVAVTAALQGAAGSLGGTTTVLTAINGQADFMNLSIVAPAGSYRLQFTASGYASATSDPIAVAASDPSGPRSTLELSADTGVAGGSVILTATIRDDRGDPIPGVIVEFAASGAGQTLQQPGGPTNAAGVATGALTATTAGTRTVTMSAGGIDLPPRVSLTVIPATAAAATTEATIKLKPILAVSTITIATRDRYGNPLKRGGDSGRLAVTVSGANSATPQVEDQGDGNYRAQFVRLLPGQMSIAITLDGTPIKGSPYIVDK